MSNIVTAQVRIRGTRPLLQHHFGPDAIPLEGGEKTGRAGNDPEEWRKTAMITDDGALFLQGPYIFGTLVTGAKYVKKGRGSIQTDVAATLQVNDDQIVLNRWYPGFPNGHAFDIRKESPPPTDPRQPVYMDVRGVVNPSTKGRNVRYRIATGPGWECAFTLMWDKSVVSREQLRAVLADAGKLVGIGSGRKIGMGRFDVISCEIGD